MRIDSKMIFFRMSQPSLGEIRSPHTFIVEYALRLILRSEVSHVFTIYISRGVRVFPSLHKPRRDAVILLKS